MGKMISLSFKRRWRLYFILMKCFLLAARPPKVLGSFLGDTKAVLHGCRDRWILQDWAPFPQLLQMTVCVDMRVVAPGSWVAFTYSSVLASTLKRPDFGLEGDSRAINVWLLRVRHSFPLRLAPQVWHRLCVRRDVLGNTFSLEVDGKLVAERTIIAQATPPHGSLWLGCHSIRRPPGPKVGVVELYLFRVWADLNDHEPCADGSVIGWDDRYWGVTSPKARERDPYLMCAAGSGFGRLIGSPPAWTVYLPTTPRYSGPINQIPTNTPSPASTPSTANQSPVEGASGSPVTCDSRHICSDKNVLFLMPLSVEVKGSKKSQQDVYNWVSKAFACQSNISNSSHPATGSIHFCHLQVVNLSCSELLVISQALCDVLLLLSHSVSACDLQQAGDSALQQPGEDIQAKIRGEVVRVVKRNLCEDVGPTHSGFLRCSSTSSTEDICLSDFPSKLSCFPLDFNSHLTSQPKTDSCSPGQEPHYCDCTAFCDSTSHFYALIVSIQSANMNLKSIKSMLLKPHATSQCRKHNQCKDYSNIYNVYKGAHVECDGSPKRLYSCQVILEMSKPVDGCSLHDLVLQSMDQSSMTMESPVHHMTVCGPPGWPVHLLLVSNLTWVSTDLSDSDVCRPNPSLFQCNPNDTLAIIMAESCNQTNNNQTTAQNYQKPTWTTAHTTFNTITSTTTTTKSSTVVQNATYHTKPRTPSTNTTGRNKNTTTVTLNYTTSEHNGTTATHIPNNLTTVSFSQNITKDTTQHKTTVTAAVTQNTTTMSLPTKDTLAQTSTATTAFQRNTTNNLTTVGFRADVTTNPNVRTVTPPTNSVGYTAAPTTLHSPPADTMTHNGAKGTPQTVTTTTIDNNQTLTIVPNETINSERTDTLTTTLSIVNTTHKVTTVAQPPRDTTYNVGVRGTTQTTATHDHTVQTPSGVTSHPHNTTATMSQMSTNTTMTTESHIKHNVTTANPFVNDTVINVSMVTPLINTTSLNGTVTNNVTMVTMSPNDASNNVTTATPSLNDTVMNVSMVMPSLNYTVITNVTMVTAYLNDTVSNHISMVTPSPNNTVTLVTISSNDVFYNVTSSTPSLNDIENNVSMITPSLNDTITNNVTMVTMSPSDASYNVTTATPFLNDTVNNISMVTSFLNDTVTNNVSMVTPSLNDTVTNNVSMVTPFLNDTVTNNVSMVTPSLNDTVTNNVSMVTPSLNDTVTNVSMVTPSLNDTVTNVSMVTPSLNDTVTNVSMVTPSLNDTVTNVSMVTPSLNDTVTNNVSMVTPSLNDTVTNVSMVTPSLNDTVTNVSMVTPSLNDTVTNNVSMVTPFLNDTVTNNVSMVTPFLNDTVTNVSMVTPSLNDTVTNNVSMVTPFLNDTVTNVSMVTPSLNDTVTNNVSMVTPFLNDTVTNNVSMVTPFLNDTVTNNVSMVTPFLNDTVTNNISMVTPSLNDTVTNNVSMVTPSLNDTVTNNVSMVTMSPNNTFYNVPTATSSLNNTVTNVSMVTTSLYDASHNATTANSFVSGTVTNNVSTVTVSPSLASYNVTVATVDLYLNETVTNNVSMVTISLNDTTLTVTTLSLSLNDNNVSTVSSSPNDAYYNLTTLTVTHNVSMVTAIITDFPNDTVMHNFTMATASFGEASYNTTTVTLFPNITTNNATTASLNLNDTLHIVTPVETTQHNVTMVTSFPYNETHKLTTDPPQNKTTNNIPMVMTHTLITAVVPHQNDTMHIVTTLESTTPTHHTVGYELSMPTNSQTTVSPTVPSSNYTSADNTAFTNDTQSTADKYTTLPATTQADTTSTTTLPTSLLSLTTPTHTEVTTTPTSKDPGHHSLSPPANSSPHTSTLPTTTGTGSETQEDLANLLINRTQDAAQLNSSQVFQVVGDLEKLLDVPSVSLQMGKKAVRVISNLMDGDSEALSGSAHRLVHLVDDLGVKLTVDGGSEVISSSSLVLAVMRVDGTNFPVMTMDIIGTDDVQLGGLRRSQPRRPESSLGSVYLPSSLMSGYNTADQLLPLRVHFSFYTTSVLFQDKSLKDKITASPVLASSVAHMSIRNLSENIEFTIRYLSPVEGNSSSSCVFWDFALNGGGGGWNTLGCFLIRATAEESTCSCNHLTAFAILLDLSRQEKVDPKHAQVLTFITYIGCGISAVFLSVTLMTYLLFDKLQRDIPAKILVQLCFSLLLLNLVFLLDGWLALYPVVGLCISTAFFLHYFLLTSFTWAGLEALHMYLSVVRVFMPYLGRYMLKFSLIGWGVPLMVVIIVISVDKDNYGLVTYGRHTDGSSDDFCWLRSDVAFYVGVVAYFLLVFVLCLLVFVLVMYQLARIKKQNPHNQSPSRGVLTDVRSVTGLVVLLGLTWGFALFAWGSLHIPFVYLFSILNSLQGFFIFVFHCAVKENVRRQWRTYLCCGRLRLAENSEWSRTAPHYKRNASLHVTNTGAAFIHTSRSSSVISDTTNSSGSSGSLFADSGISDVSNCDVVLNELHRRNLVLQGVELDIGSHVHCEMKKVYTYRGEQKGERSRMKT